MSSRLTVHVVDDDDAVRDSLCLLLRLHGYAPRPSVSGEAFLAELDDGLTNAVVLLDLRMPGMGGAEVQAELGSRNLHWPVIMLTAYGDATSARNALKAGAWDFIEKPIDDAVLLSALEKAAAEAEAAGASAARRTEIERRLARLTSRERQVLAMVVDGQQNREIAQALGISPRTVEVYKARLMDKLGIERLSDLIRLSMERGLK